MSAREIAQLLNKKTFLEAGRSYAEMISQK